MEDLPPEVRDRYCLPDLGFNLFEEHPWRRQANCDGMDPSLFFIERGQQTDPKVRITCATCLVRIECLHYAVENQEFGFWGGTSERERRAIRKAWHDHGQTWDWEKGAA